MKHMKRDEHISEEERKKVLSELRDELEDGWYERPSEVECPPITDNRSVLDE